MEASQVSLSLLPPPMFPQEAIPPSQVWIHLSKGQQHHLLQAIVLVCQELVSTLGHSQEREVTDE
jgi:hypothetical protein